MNSVKGTTSYECELEHEGFRCLASTARAILGRRLSSALATAQRRGQSMRRKYVDAYMHRTLAVALSIAPGPSTAASRTLVVPSTVGRQNAKHENRSNSLQFLWSCDNHQAMD